MNAQDATENPTRSTKTRNASTLFRVAVFATGLVALGTAAAQAQTAAPEATAAATVVRGSAPTNDMGRLGPAEAKHYGNRNYF
jgi:hypothetical protein